MWKCLTPLMFPTVRLISLKMEIFLNILDTFSLDAQFKDNDSKLNLGSFLLFLIDNFCIFYKRNLFTNIFEFFPSWGLGMLPSVYQLMSYNTNAWKSLVNMKSIKKISMLISLEISWSFIFRNISDGLLLIILKIITPTKNY